MVLKYLGTCVCVCVCVYVWACVSVKIIKVLGRGSGSAKSGSVKRFSAEWVDRRSLACLTYESRYRRSTYTSMESGVIMSNRWA